LADAAATALPRQTRLPLAVVACLWATVWALVSALEIARYLHDPAVAWWRPAVIVGVSTGVLALWLGYDLRSPRYLEPPLDPPRAWFVHHLWRLPLLAVAYFVIVYGLRLAVFALTDTPYWHLPWSVLVRYEAIKSVLIYGLWLCLVFGALTLDSWRDKSAQLVRVRQALADAELAQLQAQLRPHFLFNALNTVSALMQTDIGRADRVLSDLGDLLRASLAGTPRATQSLGEEVELLRRYADIMAERFIGRLTVEWDVDAAARAVPVPALLVQPLLENAFRHGVERVAGPVTVRLSARVEGDRRQIAVRDTGPGLDPAWKSGVGLANCRERLRILYAGAATLQLVAAAGGGVEARIDLPRAGPGR
jgi:signal transduction histidine kinase